MTQPRDNEDLEALIRQFQGSDLEELHIKAAGLELFLARDPQARAPWDGGAHGEATAAPTPQAAPQSATSTPSPAPAPANAPGAAPVPEGFAVIRAPYLGTFYRAPKPGEPIFCDIGDTVEPGADLCLVEVMKLFTAVRAEAKGVVRHIYAKDGDMVSEGQPLFALEPVD
ncbi:acetyl-CoA carboxylase biotin carboxyl carrier protein [Novosphingobium rosa]|uniref:acetyl-CoA carboxylase biotin carboxyl carrier protein n=1 Tax=Novosphingobium rosa TaxID=76978 RepID=UPI00083203AB|nr:acetyl-CoA carboxylase biotin carboxyl carrier protein subunit [Novosphingobium rosa]